MTINSNATSNGSIPDRKANIDTLLKKLRNEMNELSEQGNDITQKMYHVYSTIDQLIVSDQQINTNENEELNSKRKASTSSGELNSSGTSSSSTNSSNETTTNESNSNDDLNESILETNCKKEIKLVNEINRKNELIEQNLKTDDLYKKIPTLYSTVSKNYKNSDKLELMNNQLNELINCNNKNYTLRNNRLNNKFNYRKTSLSARTTPINNAEFDDRRSFHLHNTNLNGPINSSNLTTTNTNYYSDADSISYETIDYLGSNSIDSGYKSCKESCCATPDYHNQTAGICSTTAMLEQRKNGSCCRFDTNSFHQPNDNLHLDQTNDKFMKQYQELISKNTATNTNLIQQKNNPMNKNNRLNDSMNNKSFVDHTIANEIDLTSNLNIEQQILLHHGRTFKSALALKLSNSKLNSLDSDYCTIGRYKNGKHYHLSQSEQYLNNLNDDSIYPYLLNSAKSRHLFKNRSNLNLEQYLNKIKQQNDILKQEIEQKEQLNMLNSTDYSTNNQYSQPTKVVKRKLPQINHLYSRSELMKNKLYASKQLHSSDLNMNDQQQYETNKYEHQARFKSIYMMNNKLRRQNHLSASIEQVSNLENIYNELKKQNLLSLDSGEANSVNDVYRSVNKTTNIINQQNVNLYGNENQLMDRLYSQVQKYQYRQKSSSSTSIYYQDYLDKQQKQANNYDLNSSIDQESFIAANLSSSTIQNNLSQQNNLQIKHEQIEEKRNQQQTIEFQSNLERSKNLKENKTKSSDDLYKSMSDLVNNKFNQMNDANSKRRAFKLTSPLRTISKAFVSEATDLFKMKELAKSKFVNLIDNFASSSASNKKSQDKLNKSPIKNQAKKCSNKNSPQVNASEQVGNLYIYNKSTNHQISNLQKQPLPPLPVENHIYEELKTIPTERKTADTTIDTPQIRINYCKQRSTINSVNKEDNSTKQQSKSLEEAAITKEQFNELKLYSKSLDQEYEDEIIRKINSDETIKKIEHVISNIDTMLNNKENLNLEFRV